MPENANWIVRPYGLIGSAYRVDRKGVALMRWAWFAAAMTVVIEMVGVSALPDALRLVVAAGGVVLGLGITILLVRAVVRNGQAVRD